jgi:hypothetical protein
MTTITNNMSNDNLIPVNIVIGDRTYPIRVEAKDEEAVRKTLKIINDKILEFKLAYAGKDMQDYIAMVLIWYATQLNNGDQLQQETMKAQLQKLETLLQQAL